MALTPARVRIVPQQSQTQWNQCRALWTAKNVPDSRGLVPAIQCAEHARQLGGASPLSSLMERRISEAQGRRREAGSEGSVEQRREPMDKNRIRGIRRRTSWPMTAKSISIKGAGCRSGGCASKAVSLIAGGLLHVPEAGLRVERST